MGYVPVDYTPFDIGASREILSGLGFSEGNRLVLSLYTYSLFMPAAEVIQFSLSQSYFDVSVIELSSQGFTAALGER